MYGHPVKLNSAMSGDRHKTAIGGAFSFLINFFIWPYIAFNVKKLFLKEANRDTLHQKALDLAELRKVNYTQMNMTIFYVIEKLEPNQGKREIFLTKPIWPDT